MVQKMMVNDLAIATYLHIAIEKVLLYYVWESLEYADGLLQQLQSAEDSSMDYSPFLTKEHMLLYLLIHGTKPTVIFQDIFATFIRCRSLKHFIFIHLE